MQFPQVEIKPGESIQEADAKVEGAYEAMGRSVLAIENLNSFLPISSYCHFFQVNAGGRELVLVVMTGDWDERTLLTVLNVLLEIRMDPDPPGRPPLFRFYSPSSVPPVIGTLFGDSQVSDFECRAALVAHFGKEVAPDRALQFGTVGMVLLRECFGISTSFQDADSEACVETAVVERLRAENLPEEGAPLNCLICLGFFYGESLSQRLAYPSRWLRMRDPSPWPVLVFGEDTPAGAAGREGFGGQGSPQVIFNPLGTVISLYQDGKPSQLRNAARELERRLAVELGPVDEKVR
jgi:hypothetical protein